ncbi:Cytochrome P450 [Penicillium brevicompactum]|uniref:Cytochrome P450 n=1 Tax=Penicillium brevicompactum TaxID=5074 RepID=UPI0025425517|nr:Cytochrome P450 [Penicillium brevicompactum]KAJ5319499.1 Cytochrome P450 [Penicillium brevicompactum]
MGVLFNRSRVPLLTKMMLEEISNFEKLLAKLSKGAVNLVPTCRALEADIVSRFAFGNSIGAIDSLINGEELRVVKENDLKSSEMPLHAHLPSMMAAYGRITTFVSSLIGWRSSSSLSTQQFERWANEQLLVASDSEKGPELSFLKVMTGRISPQSALSEAKEMLGPGTDTTSATLAHILWALSFDQTLQESLVSDLRASGWTTDMTELDTIPRLVACVKEGIRWTGAASAMLPRIVPAEGALLSEKLIPGGTMVSSSPIWYLHEESAFPEPEKYRPGRWLECSKMEAVALRNDYYIPFSKGASTCIGNQ